MKEECQLTEEQIGERKFPWRLADAAVRLGINASHSLNSLFGAYVFCNLKGRKNSSNCRRYLYCCSSKGRTLGRGSQAEVRLGIYQGAVVAFKMPLDASCAEMLNNLASEVSGAFMLPNSS